MTELRSPSPSHSFRIGYLSEVDAAVEQMASLMGFTDSARATWYLCYRSGDDAIVHAHKKDVDKIVEIRLERFFDRICISVRDHGPGFKHEAVPDPTLPEIFSKRWARAAFDPALWIR